MPYSFAYGCNSRDDTADVLPVAVGAYAVALTQLFCCPGSKCVRASRQTPDVQPQRDLASTSKFCFTAVVLLTAKKEAVVLWCCRAK
jgi:hypothetical protein